MRPLSDNDEELFSGHADFISRCQKLELEKRVFDYIASAEMDYLVIDLAEFRRKLFYFPENDSWFSENYALELMFQSYREDGIIPKDYIIYAPFEIDTATRESFLANYCTKLCKIISPDRIILVEIKAGGSKLDYEQLSPDEIGSAHILNERISYAFEYVKKHIKSAHTIEFPEGISVDINHKWGKNLLHYKREYYDYALNAIDGIIKG